MPPEVTHGADDALVRRLFEASPDALWLIGFEGQTLMANQHFADMTGYPLEQMTEISGFQVADEQGRADFERHLDQMRAGHPGGHNEDVLVVRKDGTRLWALTSWGPVLDETGTRTIGYLHRLTEYTERRRLLDALRDRELQLASAQKLARLGSWSWDVRADAVWWSAELYSIFGLTPAEFGGTWDAAFARLHPDDRESVAAILLHGMRHHDDVTWEARLVPGPGDTADTGVRWIRGIGHYERDPDGVVVRMSGICQDITALRQAGIAADEATQRFQLAQQLAEAANRSTTLADALVRSAEVLADHDRWQPICIFVKQERGGPLVPLQLPEPPPVGLPRPDPEQAQDSWATGEVVVAPAPARGGHGGHSLVSLPVLSGGRTVGVIQLLADVDDVDVYTWTLLRQASDQLSRVAERERTAHQVAEARDEAMEASRHKSEFLATMSHEIRTPMNGVIGLTDLLLRSELDDQQRRLAEGLRGAGLTLLSLINDILDLSKIESGKLELEAIEFDVRTVVEETVMILAGPAQDKGLDLVVGVAPDVPRLVLGDPVRLGQVLTNLGSNAVKFTDAGEVVVDVQVESDGAPDGGPDGAERVVLRVEVRDTGIGIGEAEMDGLFDAFTQADRSTTRQHGGTGLGLAICRQLVEGMGGEVGVRSAPGAGSAFWFTARLGAVADGSDAHLDRPLTRRRVLVVDDNPTAGGFLVRQLTAWQLQVDQVGDDTEAAVALARAAAEGTPVDTVLVHLTHGDPLAAGRRLAPDAGAGSGSGSGSGVPAAELVLVADNGTVDAAAASAAGFRARVGTPVRPAELYAALLDVTGTAPERPASGASTDHDTPSLALRVLVVEDNPVNQLVAAGLLENLGCTVASVGNGAEAVETLAGEHGFDVVLMDCRMPRMDGFDATRAIRAQEVGTRVPIIAMTASALPGERDRCLEAGMDDFLTKPVDPPQLAAAISRAGLRGRPGATRTPGTPETTPAPDDVVLDPDRVDLLSELVKDGVSFFERTRMSFLSRIDGALARISIAVQDGDPDRTATDAHQLKGSALNLGLNRVGGVAAEIEDHARTGDLDGVEALVETLREAVAEGVEALAAATRT